MKEVIRMTGFEWFGLVFATMFVCGGVGAIVGMIVDKINERRS